MYYQTKVTKEKHDKLIFGVIAGFQILQDTPQYV